jgi:hypothetical protein
LEASVLAARRAAEAAAAASLDGLGVFAKPRPEHLDAEAAKLRVGLRTKWRQLQEDRGLLIAECAYEQWHRLLFARFLAENRLLLHPEYRAPVTLADCEALAPELGEPDGWSVAARFAGAILPGIFRLDDPCVRLRLAPEGRHALESILDGIPADTFTAGDALGWVYQFWQKDKKDEINDSERKIGGADLGPVTQLFTEDYMVRFLLENTLGAWWAARRPASPLVGEFEFLRWDGEAAAASLDGWPSTVTEVTVLDPCCGSGHFLVEAFSLLWRMRAEETGESAVEAQDAVLRDSLFGLELDPRCVQIAMFAVALRAWKDGGGYRQLPVPHVACSGVPVRASAEEWVDLAGDDERLGDVLGRLHELFRDADTLGSLIDPRASSERTPGSAQSSLEDVNWEEVEPLLEELTERESIDPATAVLGFDAASVGRAGRYLSRNFTLTATNVPYLGRGRQSALLRRYLELTFPEGRGDLAAACAERCLRFAGSGGTVALVLPETFFFLSTFEAFRANAVENCRWHSYAPLGPGAFETIGGRVVQPVLWTASTDQPGEGDEFFAIDCREYSGPSGKAAALATVDPSSETQAVLRERPGMKVALGLGSTATTLARFARSVEGISTGDNPRYRRAFWELPQIASGWIRFQTAPSAPGASDGLSDVIFWEDRKGALAADPGARIRGLVCWGEEGVLVGRMGAIVATAYRGAAFDKSCVVLLPESAADLPSIARFAEDPGYEKAIRSFDRKIGAATGSMVEVPFDAERWRAESASSRPEFRDTVSDPTQWIFDGRPDGSTAPLQVAVGRLLGYRWPEQSPDDLDQLADADGIICLPSVAGEAPADDQLERLLAQALGATWSPTRTRALLEASGSRKRTLAEWLRDEFFQQHCVTFANRPFVWQIWDGRRDGFSALVNYHCLDRPLLEKLAFTYLGQDWVERQRAGIADGVAGAEGRLAAALQLQERLRAILLGEPPCDIYVRWKELPDQPRGWEPNLNDGVRVNIRPFVKAGVLRSRFNIHWRKDRGKNADGSERLNDLHLTEAEKADALGVGG